MIDLYDGIFKMLPDECRKLAAPVICEVTREDQTGNKKIKAFLNEYVVKPPPKEETKETTIILPKNHKKTGNKAARKEDQ